MQDYLIRALAFGGHVRAFAARTTDIVEELRKRHDLTPVTCAALGRTATAAVMMGAMMKGDEQLTVQINGGGPIGKITADADADGIVRGYVTEPRVDLPLNAKGKLDVAGAVGTDGFLTVVKDLGLKEPYRGSSPIVSGEIAEDFTYYFAKSEQTPSAVALGVLVDPDYTITTAGGFIVQLMPGIPDEEITMVEDELERLPPITQMLSEGLSLEDILSRILRDVTIIGRMDLRFGCRCSRGTVESAIISLGKVEILSLIEEDKKAELVCHYCNEKYHFNEDDLRKIAAQIG